MSKAANSLPMGWCVAIVEEVTSRITKGTTPTTLGFNYSETGILFVKVESIQDRIIRPEMCAYISEDAHIALTRSQLQRGDVLFSIAGTLGRGAVVNDNILPANTNQALAILRPTDAIDPSFLLYQLESETVKNAVAKGGRGVGLQNLNLKQVSEFEISIPPLAEQRRIVAKIEALYERSRRAREALAEVEPLLEQFRQSMLAAAFRGDLTADWRAAHPDVEPASELLQRIRAERRRLWEQAELAKYEAKGQKPPKNWKDKYEEPEPGDESELIELPKDWCWTTLESVTDPVRVIQYGILKPGPDVPEGVPYVKVKHMVGDRINIAELQRTTPEIDAQYTRSRLARGDLLLSIRGTYGRLALVPDELERANITQDSARIALLPGIHREFGAVIIRSPYIQKHFESIAKGVAVRGINIRDIRPTAIPLPPEVEQMEIACRINQWQESIELLEGVARDAALQFDHLDQSILAKAFRGELVPQDPNDEPASSLLARIREHRAQQAEATKGSKKTTNIQRRDEMRKKSSGLSSPYRPLVEVLTTKGEPMPPEQVLTAAGYDDDSIEDFYSALREEIAKGLIRENRLTESDVVLEAVK